MLSENEKSPKNGTLFMVKGISIDWNQLKSELIAFGELYKRAVTSGASPSLN